MENNPDPDTENVAYFDEYPHLESKVKLRRRFDFDAFDKLIGTALDNVVELRSDPPDGAA